MDWKEFELHSARRQLIKTTGHLVSARKELIATLQHNRGFTGMNPTTSSIENNIRALIDGVNETIRFCAQAADNFKSQMKEPDAVPPPIRGGFGKQLTPRQRILEMQGVKFDTMPKFVPTKTEQRIAKVLSFTFTPTPRKKRNKITPDNPAIC